MKRTYVVKRHSMYRKTVLSVEEQKTALQKSEEKKRPLIMDEFRL